MIAAGLVALAAALPWLAVLPLRGAPAVITEAALLVAACHGAGLAVARLAAALRCAQPGTAGAPGTPPVLLVIAWGLAALIGASGLAIAVHHGTAATHTVLVLGCAALHTLMLALGRAHYTARIAAALAGPPWWIVPWTALITLGALAMLGTAGDGFVQPFNDETHLLAQLRRALTAGDLDDAIGFPRRAGLGGQVAVMAIAAGAGDHLALAIDNLAAVLALGLAVTSIRPADPAGALWALLVVAAGSALALSTADPLPCWSAVGLMIALYRMLRDDVPAALPLAITAGALATVRHELAVVAVAALVAAGWRRRRDHRRTVILVLGALAVAAPFVIARALAWHAMPPLAHALVTRGPGPALVPRVALTAVIAIPGAIVFRLVFRFVFRFVARPAPRAALRLEHRQPHGLAAVATATAIALAAIVAHLSGSGGYSYRLAIPIAISLLLAIVIELAHTRSAGRTAWILALVLCAVVHDGSRVGGRRRWSRRLSAAADHIATIDRPASGAAGDYARMLATTPPRATVAIWVAQPELIDYAQRRIIDLHTPAGARMRVHRWLDHRSAIVQLLATTAADYLLLETDDARELRVQSELLYRWLCRTPRPICDDDLEAIAHDHPVVAASGGLRLIALRSGQDARSSSPSP